MTDRKELIEVLEHCIKDGCSGCPNAYKDGSIVACEDFAHESVGIPYSIMRETINALKQPEIVRCKDCKNWIAGYITDQDDFIPSKCGKYQQMVGHSNDDFCSLAERL